MKRRFTKLPIASIAIVVGCLFIGLSLSPVDAQSALTNGQVTVRSDGAVYLIANGMRRWVATVVITDEELNAYPEAEPIYAGLVPFGTASAGTASTGTTTKPGTTATATAKTGSTTTNAGTTVATKTGTTVASKTGTTTSKTGSNTSQADDDDDTGIPTESGLTAKDPNDPTLAEVTISVDSSAKAEPTGRTTCPASHQIKGGFDKYYWDTDRPDYATVEPEACFVSGAYAREFGYTEVKKRGSTSSSSSPSSTTSR
jgi:hypothetical protein